MPAQFDMFSDAAPPVERKLEPRLHLQADTSPPVMSDEEMVAHLTATGRYKILRRLVARQVTSSIRPQFPYRGVILDTETTGLDHRRHEIIEIGAIAFSFDDHGAIGDIIGVYQGLQQPNGPIPVEVTRLTGITDEVVAGRAVDMETLRLLIDPADLIIAHNAGFDRPFCEAFSPAFSGKAWACSNAEIDWSSRGYEGTKLGYLIGQAGFFHDSHRAVDDCFALLEVLDRGTADHTLAPFAELYRASQRSRVRIFAENSPFELKDHLKARGYRWSDGSQGQPKSWWIEVDEPALADEIHYLRTEIYQYPEADPPTKYLTAFDRFKA